jgi:hypothetical protein
MFGFFSVGIYIKRRRKPPPARGQNEAVVSQVIIPISDSDIKGNAPKELLEIGLNVLLRTPMMQKFGHVEITCSFAMILSQHSHGGCIEPTPIADAVEALHAEGVEFAAESLREAVRL